MSTAIARTAFGGHPITTRMRQNAYPSVLGAAITPEQVAQAVAHGIETRSPRIVVPRRWAAIAALRGALGPLTDRVAEHHGELHRLLRELERNSHRHQAPPTAPSDEATMDAPHGVSDR